MKKFELTMRHTVAIVSYIAASMGYSKEEIKCIAGNMKFGSDDIGEFQEILAEPLNGIVSVKRKDEVKDLIQPFNLAERIQMVIDLILKKSNSTETIDMKPTATIYGFSPYKFSNFIRKPEEKPGLTAHEEHLADEAIRKATEETIRELKGKPMSAREEYLRDEAEIEKYDEERLELEELVKQRVEEELQKRERLEKERQEECQKKFREEMMSGIFQRPHSQMRPQMHQQMHSNFAPETAVREAMDETVRDLKDKEVEIPNLKPVTGVRSSEEIDEVNQAIETLTRLRDKFISDLNANKAQEQPNINWDNVQKAEEQPKPYEPVKFTDEQRQRLRDILNNRTGATSRYDKIGNDKVKKLNEYVIRCNTGDKYVPYSFVPPLDAESLYDQPLQDRTETEAMIHRSIEIYPSMNLCNDTLFKVNKPEEMFSFVRVDGDRLYRINDSTVQPWNRSKPLGTIRLMCESSGLFNAVKFIVKVNESVIDDIVDRNYVDIISILKDINEKYGISIKPDDINADLPAENLGQYLLRNTFSSLVAEVRKDRAHLIKTLVRDSAIVVINDMELTNWLKGKNPSNS